MAHFPKPKEEKVEHAKRAQHKLRPANEELAVGRGEIGRVGKHARAHLRAQSVSHQSPTRGHTRTYIGASDPKDRS